MYNKKNKHFKHLYKFGCIFLATIVLVCTLALPTFAMTIKPIDEGSASGSINAILSNIKCNIYVDNEYYTYRQYSGQYLFQYLYLGYDNISDVDYNDTHYGDLKMIAFGNLLGTGTEFANQIGAHYLGDNDIEGLLVEATVLQGAEGTNIGYCSYSGNELLVVRYYIPTLSEMSGQCNLMTYTLDQDPFNMVYDNNINLQIADKPSVPYMRMPYEWLAVNQLDYEILLEPNVNLINYLKGRFDINGNVEVYGYYDANNILFTDIAELFTYGTYPYTILCSVDGDIGGTVVNPPDDPPDNPPDNPPEETSRDPIIVVPQPPEYDDIEDGFLSEIVDSLWDNFFHSFQEILAMEILGTTLQNIFGICMLIVIGCFMVKVIK